MRRCTVSPVRKSRASDPSGRTRWFPTRSYGSEGSAMIGTRLANRYELISELGRGGMGVVYRAKDPLLNREVAVKLVSSTDLTPQLEERVPAAAQLARPTDHPLL